MEDGGEEGLANVAELVAQPFEMNLFYHISVHTCVICNNLCFN